MRAVEMRAAIRAACAEIGVTVALAAAVALGACGPRASSSSAPGGRGDGDAGDAARAQDRDAARGDASPPATAPSSATAPPAGATATAPRTARDAWLAAHNRVRADHCAPPLDWSAELAASAQAWADHLRDAGCAFEHSRTRYGENLAAGTRGALDPASATAMWYAEVAQYDWKRGGFSMATGHFTQVVWVGTRRLGCGQSTCKGLDILVCQYDPPGNVERAYRENVRATGCR